MPCLLTLKSDPARVLRFCRDPQHAFNYATGTGRALNTLCILDGHNPPAALPQLYAHPGVWGIDVDAPSRDWLDRVELARFGQTTAFRLSLADRRLLMDIGKGSMADGLRVALMAYREANDLPSPTTPDDRIKHLI